MASKKPPSEIPVNPHLEEARPMTKKQFVDVKNGDLDLEDLTLKQRDFYKSVVELGRNIKNNRQHYQVICRNTGNSIELITGYRRYLACVYIGQAVLYETRFVSNTDVLQMIYEENEVREDLNPYDRAVLIAKQMGRWDEENQEFLCENHEDVDDSAMTIAEFAENTGKNRGLIYQQLSPVRQNMEMREEFRDCITESSFQLIEQIASTPAEQYTLAQALSRSLIDTHSKFHSSYKLAKKKVEEDSSKDIVQILCKSLLGIEFTEAKSDYVSPEDQIPDSVKQIKEIEKERKKEEKEEAQKVQDRIERRNIGQQVPEPQDSEDNSLTVNMPDGEDEEHDTSSYNGTGGDEQTGIGVLPPKKDQPYDDSEINLTVPEGKTAQLIREECEDRDKDLSEFVVDIIEVHFRREGLLTDTPEVAEMLDD